MGSWGDGVIGRTTEDEVLSPSPQSPGVPFTVSVASNHPITTSVASNHRDRREHSPLVQPEIPELHPALELRVPAADRLGAEGDVAGVTDLDRRYLRVVRLLNFFEDRLASVEVRLGEQLRGELEAALRTPPTGILIHLSDVGDLARV